MTGLLPPQQPPWLLLSHKPAGLPSQEQRWSRVLVARRSPLADVVVCLPCPSPVLPGWGGPTGGLQLSPLTGRLRLTVPFCGLSCSSGMGTGPLSCLEAGGGSGMGLGRAGSQRPAGHSGHPPGARCGPSPWSWPWLCGWDVPGSRRICPSPREWASRSHPPDGQRN